MPKLLTAERPRLYLDIDGVIVTDNSPFEMVSLNPIEKYAPEVVARLGNTGMELVWLSSWENEATYLSENIDVLSGGRVLNLATLQDSSSDITRKRCALVADQETSPSPFVWADDTITRGTRKKVAEYLKGPKLFVQPDKRIGLTQAEIVRIEHFAKRYL